jgi:hypothetical protein
MDSRITLSGNETFLSILSNCITSNSKVAMLLDDNGLVRAEGFIKQIFPDAPQPYLEMQSGTKIVLQSIAAVNGIFVSSFCEC